MELYLIRHGETEWSRSGQHTSRTDLPLTDQGRQEAQTLAARLRGIRFDQIFSSPRLRARTTCELSGLGTPAIEPDLAEWDYGSYEGLRAAEILARQPDWDIYTHGCPDGESPAQVTARADRLAARLRPLTGRVAVFSHGHFGRVLGVRWIGLPIGHARSFVLDTAAFSILGQHDSDPTRAVIRQWNLTPGK